MTRSSITIQIAPESKPTTPSWMGEVVAFVQILTLLSTMKRKRHEPTEKHLWKRYDLMPLPPTWYHVNRLYEQRTPEEEAMNQ
jgi:hypothetical protein